MNHLDMLKKRLSDIQIESARNHSKVESAIAVLNARYGTSNLKVVMERFEAEKKQAEEKAALIKIGQQMANAMLNTIESGNAVKEEHLEKAKAVIAKLKSVQ